MGLQGLCEEALAGNPQELDKLLHHYLEVLHSEPTNTAIVKRRIALLRSVSRPQDATVALVKLLEVSPADPEAWAELSDLYLSTGLYQQAIFSLEEVLLITPNAWNIHARMGELWYLSVKAKGFDSTEAHVGLAQSVKWFCRSIELCDDYLRGFYGLKMATDALLALPKQDKVEKDASTISRLNTVATAKLASLVGDTGIDPVGTIAAQTLLAAKQ